MNIKKNLCLFVSGLILFGSMAGCGKAAEQTKAEETTPVKNTASPASSVSQESLAPETSQSSTAIISQYDGYTLLWHDEFDGNSLDMNIWNYEPHQPGWTNNELQEYTTSEKNVFVDNGQLVIKAVKTTDAGGKDYYTSGKVTTQNRKDFTYGKVVARAKVSEGKGLWPAIWMMPQDEEKYGQWPKCGEIDILEVLGNQTDTAYGTIHYGEPHAQQQGTYVLTNGTFASDFHEFSVEWEPGEMRFYIDGNLYKTVNDWFTAVSGEDEKPYPAPFNQPFFVQLNLAVGGTWPGNPDETTSFDKAEFSIDYIRVYQKPAYDTNVQKPKKLFAEPLADGNYIHNGDFSETEDLTDDIGWKFLLFQNGEGTAEIKDGMMTITSKNEGVVDYSVQLVQPNIPMINGKKYRASFDAYSDEKRDIIVCVSAPDNGWIRYLPDTTLTLSTKWKSYAYEFEMTGKDDPNGRLEFNLGHRGSVATVHIKNVRVVEIK